MIPPQNAECLSSYTRHVSGVQNTRDAKDSFSDRSITAPTHNRHKLYEVVYIVHVTMVPHTSFVVNLRCDFCLNDLCSQ